MKDLRIKVLKYIDDHESDLLGFLSKMISFNTGNPPGLELEAQDWLKEELHTFGFDIVDYWAVDQDKKRPNVVAVRKGSGGRGLIFNGHIDVSPVSEEDSKKWSYGPWSATVKDGKLYGRGSTDMKGGLASVIWSAKALIDNGVRLKGDLIIESAVGEEWGQHQLGTTAICQRGYRAPLAIVVEPTDCEIHAGQSGVIAWDIFVPGKATHVANRNLTAFPQRTGVAMGEEVGVDAFRKMMKIVRALDELEAQWIMRKRQGAWGSGGIPNHDLQGVGLFNNSIVAVEAGDFNVWAIAGHCRIRGTTYYPPWVTADDVKKEMWATIESVGVSDDWIAKKIKEGTLTFNPNILCEWPPTSVPIDHEGCKILYNAWKEAVGSATTYSGTRYVSDASFLALQGIPTVIMGPGDINMGCHGMDEYVPIRDLLNCAKTFALTAIDWCGLSEK